MSASTLAHYLGHIQDARAVPRLARPRPRNREHFPERRGDTKARRRDRFEGGAAGERTNSAPHLASGRQRQSIGMMILASMPF